MKLLINEAELAKAHSNLILFFVPPNFSPIPIIVLSDSTHTGRRAVADCWQSCLEVCKSGVLNFLAASWKVGSQSHERWQISAPLIRFRTKCNMISEASYPCWQSARQHITVQMNWIKSPIYICQVYAISYPYIYIGKTQHCFGSHNKKTYHKEGFLRALSFMLLQHILLDQLILDIEPILSSVELLRVIICCFAATAAWVRSWPLVHFVQSLSVLFIS